MQDRKLNPAAAPATDVKTETAVAPRAAGSRWPAVRNSAALYAAVALGSVIGAVLRALASVALLQQFGPDFPWGTLFVNVTGSFVIGFYAAWTGPDGRMIVGPRQRQFVMTGICGGYTTFSAFSLETFQFLQAGHLPAAGLNVVLSVVMSLVAVWLGHLLATRLNRLKGS
jgi:CrcB protein